MSTKSILALGATTLLLYLAFPYALLAVFPRTEVEYETPVKGHVTGSFQHKKQRSFYLDGRTKLRYTFDAFTRARPAGQEPSEDQAIELSAYLKKGDYLFKAAHAAALTVQRGDSTSHWTCAPPESDR